MGHLRRFVIFPAYLLACFAALLSPSPLTPSAVSQTLPIAITHVSLTALLDGTAGMQSGTVCLTPADGNGNPITVSVPGYGLVKKGAQFCQNVVNGAFPASLGVPNACATNNPGQVTYNVAIQELDASGDPVGVPVVIPAVQNICGTSYALDAYAPVASTATPVSPPLAQGNGIPTSCSAPSLWLQINPPTLYSCQSGVYVSVGVQGPVGPPGTLIPPAGVNLVNPTTVQAGEAPRLNSTVLDSAGGAQAVTGLPVQGAGTVTSNQQIQGDSVGAGHGYVFLDVNGAPISTAAAPVTLVSTTFNEGAAGASLIGTKPATSSSGNLWTLVSGGVAPTFYSGGVTVNQASGGQPALLDLGQSNEVLTFNIANYSGGDQIFVRYTDQNNYVAININVGNTIIYEGVAGNFTPLATINGNINGTPGIVVTLAGANVTVNDGIHAPVTVTLTGAPSMTATKIGLLNEYGGSYPLQLSAFSAIAQGANPAASPTAAGMPIAVPSSAVTLNVATTGAAATWMLVKGSVLPASYQGYWLAGASASSGASGPTDIVYTSKIAGMVSDTTATPGAEVEGVDQAAKIQAVLNGGNVWVVNDGCYSLSSTLRVYANTRYTVPPWGCLLMKTASNAPMFANIHPNAPTTASGTGGYLVSNQTDHDIFLENYGTLNFNSTVAVTGSDSTGGNNQTVAHKDNPATGQQVVGMLFVGVDRLKIRAGLLYNAATFTVTTSNVSHYDLGEGQIVQPTPLVMGKNTDGAHPFGPMDEFRIHDLDLTTGDDAVGLNADDVHEPRTFNFNGTAFSGVKWGPITNGVVENLHLNNTLSGVRFLSLTEREDNIVVRNLTGTTQGPVITGTPFFASGGTGNFGHLGFSNINVAPSSSQSFDPLFALIDIGGTWDTLTVGGTNYQNPVTPVPLLRFGNGTMNELIASDTTVNNPAGTAQPAVFQIGGRVKKCSVTGFSVTEPSGWTGSVFGGAQPCDQLAASNYNGPFSNLLASNWSNVVKSGDAFTAPAGAGQSYILRTTFTEGAAGANLTGTAPATFTGTGTWTQPSGTSSAFIAGGVSVPNEGANDATVIDMGATNYTARYTFGTYDAGWTQMVLRYTNRNNYVAVNMQQGQLQIYDCTAGTCNQIGSTSGSVPTGTPLTVTAYGSTITAWDGITAVATGTLPSGTANATSSKVGFLHYGSGTGSVVVSQMMVTP